MRQTTKLSVDSVVTLNDKQERKPKYFNPRCG